MSKCKHYDICGLNADFSDGLCILHTAKPDKDKKAFAKKFEEHRKNKRDDFRYVVFPERIDFREATFTEKANFSEATFTKGADFFKATFTNKADFGAATFTKKASFLEATFTKDANFTWAMFTEEAYFFTATFTNKADFTAATFTKDATFIGATFTEDANFREATFIREANFREATFTEDATFTHATFTEETDFAEATFTKGANFFKAMFMRGASFDGTIFTEGDAIFSKSHLLGRTLFLGGKEKSEVLRVSLSPGENIFLGEKENKITEKTRNLIFINIKAYFNNVDINPPNVVIFRDADLGHCSFLGTRIDKVEFTNVKWAVIPGKLGYSRTGIYDELILRDSIKSKKKSKIKDKKKLDWEHIERVYRDLKINHTASGDHERAGDFHYGEKEMRRRNADTPPAHRFFLNLYRLISGYGERYLRPLIWAVVMLVFCTFGYLLLGISEVTIPLSIADPMDWIKTSLYSLQVMAFMRPTYLEHTSLASTGLKVVQSIFGPVIIGLFALALRQRLKR